MLFFDCILVYSERRVVAFLLPVIRMSDELSEIDKGATGQRVSETQPDGRQVDVYRRLEAPSGRSADIFLVQAGAM